MNCHNYLWDNYLKQNVRWNDGRHLSLETVRSETDRAETVRNVAVCRICTGIREKRTFNQEQSQERFKLINTLAILK